MFAASDLVETARLFLLLPLSWIVPLSSWPPILRALVRVDGLLRKAAVEARVDHVRRVLYGFQATAAPQTIVRRWLAVNFESRMQVLRDYLPGAWRPAIDIEGLAHIERALDDGNGVILWVSNFAFSSHITKMALSQADVHVCHLSRPTHGFSKSRFGIWALNPIQTRIEDRYLGERLTVTPQNGRDVWRRMQEKLGENEIVSITVGDQARRIARPRFFAGRMRLATGPAHLARITGAALLPVHTLQTGPGRFTVQIGAPLGNACHRNDGATTDQVLEEFVEGLRPLVLRYPSQWRNWALVDLD